MRIRIKHLIIITLLLLATPSLIYAQAPTPSIKKILFSYWTTDTTSDLNTDQLVNIIDVATFWSRPRSTPTPTVAPTNSPTPNPTATPTRPPGTPTLTPTPRPSGPPPAGEVLLFDKKNLQYVSSDQGFLIIKNPYTNVPAPNPSSPVPPTNWLSPRNYWGSRTPPTTPNATLNIRLKIIEHPSNFAGKIQYCIWNMPGFHPEACAPMQGFDSPGDTVYLTTTPAQWAGIPNPTPTPSGPVTVDPLDFSNPYNFYIRLALKSSTATLTNCSVSPKNAIAKKCWELWPNFQNTKFNYTVVMVPQGQTFSGWQNYP